MGWTTGREIAVPAAIAAAIVFPTSLWTLSRAGITVRPMFRACFRPALGGALMTAASLLVSRLAGGGVGGLAAAAAAGAAIYLLVVYPMRALLQRSPERSAREGVGDPANSGETTSYSNLGNPGS